MKLQVYMDEVESASDIDTHGINIKREVKEKREGEDLNDQHFSTLLSRSRGCIY